MEWRWEYPESFSGVVFPAIEKVLVASNYDTTVFESMPSVPKQQSKTSQGAVHAPRAPRTLHQ